MRRSTSTPQVDVGANLFVEFACYVGIKPSPRARKRFEPSSSKLHRPKRGNGKQVADDVSCFHTSKSGRCKSRLEQNTHLPGGNVGGGARIKLFDRFKRGETLRGSIFHRIEIFIGEQRE